MNEQVKICGCINKVFYAGPTFSAGRLATEDGDMVSFAGNLHAIERQPVILVGRWERHPKFGRQFKVDHVEIDLPTDEEGLTRFIANHPDIKGIGPSRAAKIAQAFGEDFEQTLLESPEEIARVAKVPTSVIENLREVWTSARWSNAVMTRLSGFGLTHHQVTTLVEKLGNNILGVLQHDPYCIIHAIKGFGFKRIDPIARKMGTPKESVPRIRAGIEHCLFEALDQGHCWIESEELIARANTLLIMDCLDSRERIERELDTLLREKRLDCVDLGGRVVIALPFIHKMERDLAEVFAQASLENPHFDPQVDLTDLEGQYDLGALNDRQCEAVVTALSSRISLISGGAGTGKAQPLDAKLLTPTGWKRMGDIQLGDMVIGAEGQPIKVTGVFPQGLRDVYRVTMTDGASTECCVEHLWLTKSQKDRDRRRSGNVKPLMEIKDSLQTACGKHKHWIPIVHPIEFESHELPLDPYVLGLLLGDGCFLPNCCVFTNPEPSIIESLQGLLPSDVVLTQSKSRSIDYHIRRGSESSTNSVVEMLRRLGLAGKKSYEKFVPDTYKFTPSSQRLALLQGLLDTDGSASRSSIEYTTTSHQLAQDVQFLVQSLGGTCNMASRTTHYTHNGEKRLGRVSYRLRLCLPGYIQPFRLPRKASAHLPRVKYFPRRAIEKVELVGRKQTQCIAVNARDHLYVTDDFIVTHNTYTVSTIQRICESHNLKVVLTAPTGKAARRMQETSGREATTIHRLLGYNGKAFSKGPNNLLDADLVIVDEVSQVDVSLAWHLFQALDLDQTAVVLVGDHNQLPPVGAGNILRDLIQTRAIPTTILEHCVRQAGVLKENSTAILKGEVRKTSEKRPDGRSDWYVVDHFTDPLGVTGCLRELFSNILEEKLGFDLLRDVQVLTPTHKGPLGTQALNEEIQRLVQRKLFGVNVPPHQPNHRPPLLKGDKVIQTRNNYDLGVMNGTVGMVRDIRPDGTHLFEFDGEEVLLQKGDEALRDIQLGFALSIHRTQGSEFPCAILIVHKSHAFMHNRSIFYTGVTRARRTAIILGDRWGVRNCAAQIQVNSRNTFLSEFLFESRGMLV